ncbi:hypothetical protein KY326_04080 [Candidatus Woesearchaeota archaeon]|nr:hypothetical protein [Candidatus Woesearchaeota archaeon]
MAKKRGSGNSVISKLNRIDLRLSKVEKLLGKVYRKEKEIGKEEKRVEKEEIKIEKEVSSLKGFIFRRGYIMELVRGTAGAFLGVGIGEKLIGASKVAESLSWVNIFGILAFILIISGLLIFKNEKMYIAKRGKSFVFQRLLELYSISIVMEILGLFLFAAWPGWNVMLVKTLIIGSYAAMSGAVSFSILD